MPERVQQKEIYKLYNKKKKKKQANCSPSVAQLTSIRLNSLITADWIIPSSCLSSPQQTCVCSLKQQELNLSLH